MGIARPLEPEHKFVHLDYRQCDITDNWTFDKLCQETYSKFGHIDILINSTGFKLPAAESYNYEQLVNQTLRTNLVATYKYCDVIIKFMKLEEGSIININSIGSYFGFPGNPTYAASN